MSLAVAIVGWALAGLLAGCLLRQRRQLEFVARADHELRGAATVLRLGVAALRREPGGSRRARLFESQLDRLAAGLADLAAARGGRTVTRAAAVPLERVVRNAAAGWSPAARSAGRKLRFRWDGEAAIVSADRGRLAQVLSNLMGNALEHGSGPIEVSARRSGRRARVEVRDDGPSDRPRRVDGGRGLRIAGDAVEEAGGTLKLERTPEGTVAAVELPLTEP